MNIIVLITLIFTMFSCRDNLDTVQCSPIFEPIEKSSAYAVTCLCREYKFSRDYIGRIGNWQEAEISLCDGSIGFPLEDYPDVYEFWEEVRQEIKDKKSRK